MKKFFKVVQDEGQVSIIQVDLCNTGRHDGRFAGITVLKGPDLSFGQWLCIFKKEIIEKNSKEIQRTLNQYNEYYGKARIEVREMFRSEEDPEWCAIAIKTAFEQIETEAGTEYRFIEKRFIDPMFAAGSIHIESFFITNEWTVKKAPKRLFVICALWKKYDWSRYIYNEDVVYAELTPKEYYWEVAEVSISEL